MNDKINGYGSIFRFITPILIAVVGYLLSTGMAKIEKKIDDLDTHFTNHLSHHQDLEVGYADRLAKIESNRFSQQDIFVLKDEINDLKLRIKVLESKRR